VAGVGRSSLPAGRPRRALHHRPARLGAQGIELTP
jgi:hypothetical protein